jgi:hypothetical protein
MLFGLLNKVEGESNDSRSQEHLQVGVIWLISGVQVLRVH